jgi:hypothetical protein
MFMAPVRETIAAVTTEIVKVRLEIFRMQIDGCLEAEAVEIGH